MGENEHGRFHISPRRAKEAGGAPEPFIPAIRQPRRTRLPGIARWWQRLFKGVTLGVRAVVLRPDGAVLLVRHTYVAGWQFPGGGVEAGETVREALARELEEETAVEPLGEPRLHGIFFNSFLSRRDHVVVFVVERYRMGLLRLPNREIADARFFPLDQLPADTTPGTRRRLHEIGQSLPPAPRW
ncbi:NUDIX domain-containing protein [Ancylobacter sp. 6x-1]|uniref:NUDIX domain-containing protein n=1 Tax=Ancylobacter crimeensis TaxID=2579147 RepID=A0ABT0D9J9_9HYPH|nr:NUDIX domain-containing protein [Ancylobacter crimeensis]MCK0196635.1 NUDIX domain-containing protein [Ancylobacter crimeensis]